MRIATQCGLVVVFCSSVLASEPSLTKLQPRGAQIGKAVKLTLIGDGLIQNARVITKIPGTLTPLTLSGKPSQANHELSFLLELSSEAAVGVYPIRVQTNRGLSNVLLFNVGAFPETEELESQQTLQAASLGRYEDVGAEPMYVSQIAENNSIETAQEVFAPATINGTLPIADRDYYSFNLKASQRLVLEAECRRIGSAIDPVIEVYNSAGRRLGRNDDGVGIGLDARVDLSFPEAGRYFVAVYDSKFSAQQENFYRLKIGDYSYATGVFPLGWQRGESVDVEIYDESLEKPLKVRPNFTPVDNSAEFVDIPVPGKRGALPLRFVLGDGPETFESEGPAVSDIQLGTFVNGRISGPGERDRYRVIVKPGENWHFELEGGTGISPLHGVLTLYDHKDNKLASTSDMGLRKKYSPQDVYEEQKNHRLNFLVPGEIESVFVEVEDLLRRGGPEFCYRLRAYKQADFSLAIRTTHVNIPLRGTALVLVTAERKGYTGPIKLVVPNPPNDLIVRGGNIPMEDDTLRVTKKASNGMITLTPKPGATLKMLNLQIWGEAVIGGRLVRRRARGPGIIVDVDGPTEKNLQSQGFSTNVAPWIGVDLPAVIVDELPAVLEVMTSHHLRLIQGTKFDFPWVFTSRQRAVGPPLPIGGNNLLVPVGVRTTQASRQDLNKPSQGVLVLGLQVGWGPGKIDAVVFAEALVGGLKEKFYAPAVTVDVVSPYEIDVLSDHTILKPGAQTDLLARLKREPGFTSSVEIEVENLPPGVSCEGAVVPGYSEEFDLACRVKLGAKPGEYEIDLRSSSTVLAGKDKEIPFNPPPLKTKLTVL